MKVLCVAGARPNFMKIKPVLAALEERGATTSLVHTGQHYDPLMSDVFFEELDIRRPDRFLGVGGGSHAVQTARIMTAFEELLPEEAPDAVVVVGDVNSTLACALVTAKAGPLLAHVEAGLRSRDWAMPEEVNRVVTDRLSDYLFAPSPDAVENLRSEGYRDDQIHLAGNVMVDTLLSNLERARARTVIGDLGLEGGGYALMTLHRPSNVDDPETLAGIVGAVGAVARRLPVVFPVHPRTRANLDGAALGGAGLGGAGLGGAGLPKGLRLVDPVGYLDFIALEAGARVVLTDSGGIQEETTVLGIPCLTLRRTTERPITISEGTNRLVGVAPDAIVAAAGEVLDHGVEPRRPELWDGRAGGRIADVIVGGGTAAERPRPTDLAR